MVGRGKKERARYLNMEREEAGEKSLQMFKKGGRGSGGRRDRRREKKGGAKVRRKIV